MKDYIDIKPPSARRPMAVRRSDLLDRQKNRARNAFRLAAGVLLLTGVGILSNMERDDVATSEAENSPQSVEVVPPVPNVIEKLPDLKLNSNRADVIEYQENLLSLNYDLGKWGADGDYGFSVVLETLKFQYQHALPLTGVADDATQRLVIEKVAEGWQTSEFTIKDSIALTAQKTGLSAGYLGAKAFMESSFNTTVRAKTTSATGLEQFTDDAIVKAVFHHGHKYGLDNFVKKIKFKSNGTAALDEAWLQGRILEVRKDPLASLLLSAEVALAAEDVLKERMPKMDVGDTERYFTHFLGTNGGASFLEALEKNDQRLGKDLFSGPAKRNKGIFYNGHISKPRTLREIYDHCENKIKKYKALLVQRKVLDDPVALPIVANKPSRA